MLELRKKGNKHWLLIDDEIGEFTPSKFTINRINNVINVVYFNNLKSKEYNVSDCYIFDIDDTSGFNTSNGVAFMDKLEELNCPCFQKDVNNFYISGGTWGSITGDIEEQADLQNALDSKLDKVSTAGVERAYIINADGSQGTKATSDFKAVVEGYFNGTNFYTDAGFTILITGETGIIYVALDTTFTYRWSGSAYVEIGGGRNYNPSFWISDKLIKTSSVYFVNAALNAGNFFGGSSPNTSSFKTMLGIGIMSGTNANGGGRYKNEAANAIRPTPELSFYSCFNLANTTRDNFIKIGFFNNLDNVSSVTDGFWLQINGVNATLNTANGGVNSQSSSSALTTTYMECLVEYISSTEVKCKVKELLTGNVVFNQTLTTNIPTTAKTFGGGLIATITTAGASNTICSIQELAFGIKPEFLKDF